MLGAGGRFPCLRRDNLELDRPGAVRREGDQVVLVEFGMNGVVAPREAVAPVVAALGLLRQERVADSPVAERAEAAARRPLAVAEVPGLVVVKVARAGRAAVVPVRLARRAVHRLGGNLGDVVRRLRELRLVVVVHVHHGVRHHHLAHRGLAPREKRVAEEAVVARKRAEVVPVGVAVALRILVGRVVLVDDALVVSGDVVVDGVGHLARRDALREVPHEAVVVRRDVRRGRVVAATAAQERQLLVEERRHLVVEREERGRKSAVVELEARHLRVVEVRPEADRRVERVDVRLVAERVVEVGEARHGELELLVRVRVVDAHLERHRLRLGEQRLVELDETRVLERVVVERHVALVGLARLDDHRDGRLRLVLHEVPHPLRERRHVVEDALHPPFRERGRIGPLRPRVAHRRVGGRIRVLGPVADGVVRVHHVGERVALVADREAREAGGRIELLSILAVEVLRHGAVGVRTALAPLEDVLLRLAGERLAVDDRKLLREEVERVLARDDAARVVPGDDLYEVHRDRIARGDVHERVGGVVLDERDVVRGAHREERVVVARLVHDAVFGSGDRPVPARLHAVFRERGDGRAPRLLARGRGRLVEERGERLALGRVEDVHVEERDAGGIVFLLALELQAARDVRGRVEVEPLGDGRRQPVERPAPLAQRPVAARALLDAEVGDRVGDGRVGRLREAARLRHRGVEEDRGRVARGVRRRPHHAHGLAVPHFREARRRDGERAADLDFGDVLRPRHAPRPRMRLGGEGRGRRRRTAQKREPRNRRADLGPARPVEGREREALLHAVVHAHRRRAGGARPELVLAVAERGRRRRRLVPRILGAPRIVEEVDRVRAGERLARHAVARELGIDAVRDHDAEPLHRLSPVLYVLDEHARRGRRLRVEVGAKRPRHVAARARTHDRVLLVRVVAGLVRLVLHIHPGSRVRVRIDDAVPHRGRAVLLQKARVGPADGAEHLVREPPVVRTGDFQIPAFDKRIACGEMVLAPRVRLAHFLGDLAGRQHAVPRQQLAHGDALSGRRFAPRADHAQMRPGLRIRQKPVKQ